MITLPAKLSGKDELAKLCPHVAPLQQPAINHTMSTHLLNIKWYTTGSQGLFRIPGEN